MQAPIKIALVGNVASGKTRLARQLSIQHKIPVTHVDAVQFNQDLSLKNINDIRSVLLQIQSDPTWIIDGHGPLDLLDKRFAVANKIIFLDPPIYLNIFWLSFRLIKSIFLPRQELPPGSNEFKWTHIKKLYRTLWVAHKKMRPELIRMLNRPEFKNKVMIIASVRDYREN
jgi:hypothetical protein